MNLSPATYKTPRVSEHEEQKNFITEVHMRYASRDDFIPALLFSVPNGIFVGGENKFALMAKYRAEGFRNGVADLIYLQPRGPYSCLCLEFKALDQRTKKDGGVSPEQSAFLAAVNAAGGNGDVCYGAVHATIIFDAYMRLDVRP